MAYTLIIGNKNYSSWSMRAWLLLKFVGVSFKEISVDLYTQGAKQQVIELGGETGLVPVLIDDGFAIWETMAITEYLYESFPQIWPSPTKLRANARSICNEINSGMVALRTAMPMNIKARKSPGEVSLSVKADINRVENVILSRLAKHNNDWLFGEFCAADIMLAPIATRMRTYGVVLAPQAQEYIDRLLAHDLIKQWSEQADKDTSEIESVD